jgi:hypothetical protein
MHLDAKKGLSFFDFASPCEQYVPQDTRELTDRPIALYMPV